MTRISNVTRFRFTCYSGGEKKREEFMVDSVNSGVPTRAEVEAEVEEEGGRRVRAGAATHFPENSGSGKFE